MTKNLTLNIIGNNIARKELIQLCENPRFKALVTIPEFKSSGIEALDAMMTEPFDYLVAEIPADFDEYVYEQPLYTKIRDMEDHDWIHGTCFSIRGWEEILDNSIKADIAKAEAEEEARVQNLDYWYDVQFQMEIA